MTGHGINILLMGYRCTGKTAAGRCLAARLGLPFQDTDELIAGREGQTVETIVARRGWSAFREAEHAVIRRLSQSRGSVIALGGGAVINPGNVEALRENGLFVWLRADAATIVRRLQKDQAGGAPRPSLTGLPVEQEVRGLLAEREAIYSRLADLAVDTTLRTVEEVSEAIAAGLGKRDPREAGVIGRKEP
jgi:shikimate kinase